MSKHMIDSPPSQLGRREHHGPFDSADQAEAYKRRMGWGGEYQVVPLDETVHVIVPPETDELAALADNAILAADGDLKRRLPAVNALRRTAAGLDLNAAVFLVHRAHRRRRLAQPDGGEGLLKVFAVQAVLREPLDNQLAVWEVVSQTQASCLGYLTAAEALEFVLYARELVRGMPLAERLAYAF